MRVATGIYLPSLSHPARLKSINGSWRWRKIPSLPPQPPSPMSALRTTRTRPSPSYPSDYYSLLQMLCACIKLLMMLLGTVCCEHMTNTTTIYFLIQEPAMTAFQVRDKKWVAHLLWPCLWTPGYISIPVTLRLADRQAEPPYPGPRDKSISAPPPKLAETSLICCSENGSIFQQSTNLKNSWGLHTCSKQSLHGRVCFGCSQE